MRGHWKIVALVTLALGLWASPSWGPVLVDRSPTSPFALFGRDDLRVGRRFGFYESVARKEHHRPYRCTRLWARAHACRVRTTDIPAVIISACEPDLRGRAQLRPEAWLEKPFRCETLLEVVKKYVTPERGGLIDS